MSLSIPRPQGPCHRCQKNHDVAEAVLITCAKCERVWHHTCHVPSITEVEMLDRINNDKAGKRSAGLSAWQCRTCTKKSRLAAPVAAAAPATLTHTMEQPVLTQAPPETIVVKDNTVPIIVDDDDDDIELIEPLPKEPIHPATSAAQKPSLPVIAAHSDRLSEDTLRSSSIPRYCFDRDMDDGATPAVHHTQAVPTWKGKERAVFHASSFDMHAKSRDHLLPPTPARMLEEGSNPSHSTRPPGWAAPVADSAAVRPASPSSSYVMSAADIRPLISGMHAEGRSGAPLTVEYVNTRPSHAIRKRATSVPHIPPPDTHTISDSDDDESGDEHEDNFEISDSHLKRPVMQQLAPTYALREEEQEDEVAEEAEDPHNIDDLYGDIAPRFRKASRPPFAAEAASGPASTESAKARVRVVPAPPPLPPVVRLLYTEREKRAPRSDDLALILEKKARLAEERLEDRTEEGAIHRMSPRKKLARRLGGKELRKKQEQGLTYLRDVAAKPAVQYQDRRRQSADHGAHLVAPPLQL